MSEPEGLPPIDEHFTDAHRNFLSHVFRNRLQSLLCNVSLIEREVKELRESMKQFEDACKGLGI